MEQVLKNVKDFSCNAAVHAVFLVCSGTSKYVRESRFVTNPVSCFMSSCFSVFVFNIGLVLGAINSFYFMGRVVLGESFPGEGILAHRNRLGNGMQIPSHAQCHAAVAKQIYTSQQQIFRLKIFN